MNSAVGVGLELVVAGDGREEVALPTLRFEGRGTGTAGGTIAAHVDADVGGLAGRGGAVDGGEGQATGLAIGVVEVGGRDGDEGAQIAEAGEGGVVPEDAVAARGDEEGDDDVGVVLPEIEVVALDVGDAELHLAEAVEGLVGLGVPALLDVECVFALHGGGLQRAAARGFGEDCVARGVCEGDGAGVAVDDDVQFGSGEDEGRRPLSELPAGGEGGIGNNVERGAAEEIGGARKGHADDAVGEELDAEIAGVEVEGEAVGLAVHLRRRCRSGWRRLGCMKRECGEAERGCENCGLCCGSELHEESVRAGAFGLRKKGCLPLFAEGPGLKPFPLWGDFSWG